MKLSSLVNLAIVLATSVASSVHIIRPSEPFVQGGNSLPKSQRLLREKSLQLSGNLGRSTVWRLVQTTSVEGDTGEPEGMARFGENRSFVSAGQWTVAT